MKTVPAVSAMLVFLLAAAGAEAQKRRVPIAKRCVDRVELRDGPTLYGAILGRADDGTITMAVERDWLKSASKSLYERQVLEETRKSRQALVTLQDRLKQWIESKTDEKRFVKFLQKELKRLEDELKELNGETPPVDAQFLIVEIPGKQVKQGYAQTRPKRKVAVAAWKHRLPDVESREVTDLVKQLHEMEIDVNLQRFDLSDRLPRRGDSSREWAARKAILEHHFGNSLQFQGTGDFLVETGGEAGQPPVAELLQGIVQQQVGKELSDLPGTSPGTKPKPDDGLAKAVAAADGKKLSAVVVTRLNQNLTARKVIVEKLFLANMPGGKWEAIWKHVETADASMKRPELEKNLEEHPQIKQLLQTVKSLGLPAADERFRTAIRFGAATSEAQQQADMHFFDFENRYVQQLDGPPLILPAGR